MSKEKTWILPIILFLAIVSINPVAITVKGFTCSECEALYWASVDYYSEYESDILTAMNGGASYEARFAVIGSESKEVCSSR